MPEHEVLTDLYHLNLQTWSTKKIALTQYSKDRSLKVLVVIVKK